MRRYIYVGTDPDLRGLTALGQWMPSKKFCVLVNETTHPMAYDWHVVDRSEWKLDFGTVQDWAALEQSTTDEEVRSIDTLLVAVGLAVVFAGAKFSAMLEGWPHG